MKNILFTFAIDSANLANPYMTQKNSSHFIKHSLWISYVLLAAGIGLLVWLIQHVGAHLIWDYLVQMGWKFIPFLFISFLTFILFTWSWNAFLEGHHYTIKFWKLFMLKVTGEAVNNVNPLGFGGGDPVRIFLMKKYVPVAESTASVVIDRTMNSIALVVFMLVGILIAFMEFNLPESLKIGFPLSLCFIIWMTYYWYKRQHEGVFQFLVEILIKLRIKKHWSDGTLQKLKEIDSHITEFYQHNKKGFYLAFCLQMICRLLGVFEIYAAAYFLGMEMSVVSAYLLASVTVLVNLIFVFVPGSVGVLEGAYAGIFQLMHQNPAVGTSIGILRRIRMLLWSAIGLYYIYHQDRKTRLALKNLALTEESS